MSEASADRWRRVARRLLPQPVRVCYWRMIEARQQRRVLEGQVHEPEVCATLRRIVRPGWVCADVGANVGLISVLIGRLVGPTGRLHAFEPHPDNVRLLEQNLLRYGFEDRALVVRAAVSDGRTDRVALHAGRRRSRCEWNIVGHDADGQPTEPVLTVPATSLDRHFPPDQRLDLVKIDVEGAEARVLAGMQRVLRQWSPHLLIECHSGENWSACLRLLGLGYRLETLAGEPIDATARPAAHLVARPPRRAAARAS